MKNITFIIAMSLTLAHTLKLNAQVPGYAPSAGIVAWYEFNGNTNDLSANSIHGLNNGASLASDRFGQAGKAYQFSAGEIILGTDPKLNLYKSFTIAGWFNSTSSVAVQGIVSRESPSYQQTPWLFRLNANKVSLWLGDGSAFTEFSTHQKYQVNEWQHAVVSFDSISKNVKIYLNGELDLDTVVSQTCLNYSNVGTKIGRQYNACQFYGKLDDIGIWDRTLSKQEVRTLFHAGLCYHQQAVTDTLFINWNISGFNPIRYKNSVKIWPNPTRDRLYIDNVNYVNYSTVDLQITNAAGIEVFRSKISQPQFVIDLSTWVNSGLYFVKLINPDGSLLEVRKIVLQ